VLRIGGAWEGINKDALVPDAIELGDPTLDGANLNSGNHQSHKK
jgi:hypothetical protein